MINNEWERFGDEIRRTIQDAVDSRDFTRLNQTVSDTIGQAMDNVSRGLKNGGWYRDNPKFGNRGSGNVHGYGPVQEDGMGSGPAGSAASGRYQTAENSQAQPKAKGLYLKAASTRIGGIFLAATGYVFGIGALIFLILFLIGAVATGWELVMGMIASLFGIFVIAFAVMAGIGTGMVCSVGRFRKYVGILKEREFCDVKELAQKTGKSVKTVVKDLRKMIKKGWFRQGHLDEQGTCLMVSDDAYRQYTALMERMRKEKEEKAVAESRAKAAADKARRDYEKLPPEVQKIVDAGDEYVRKIRAANDAIPGEEISAKISRMEMLVDRIFDRVEENPDSISDIRRLMEYYLPTTIKLLEAYEDLDAQPVQGENIISAKSEIEKTLDTLNAAFEKLLDDLFQDTAWDLSSDISVLNTMLAQEGLTDDGLKVKR